MASRGDGAGRYQATAPSDEESLEAVVERHVFERERGENETMQTPSRLHALAALIGLFLISLAVVTTIPSSSSGSLSSARARATQLQETLFSASSSSSSASVTSSSANGKKKNKDTDEEEEDVELEDSSVDSSFDFTGVPISFSLARQNYDLYPYFGESPNEYAKYAFLAPHAAIIEPGQAMELSVWGYEASSLTSTYKFTLCSTKDSDDCYLGENLLVPADGQAIKRVTIECRPYETYSISVEEVDADDDVVATASGTAVCMYVRREMRALTSDDLSKTMDAMFTLWDVDEDTGQGLYGEQYHSASYFAAAHDFNAAQQDADHIHEGLGFLPQHIKLTNMFEEAMQAVDPSITLPYWDFTMDVAYNQTIFESVMFTEDTFGSMTKPADHYWGFTWANDDLSNTYIQDGRWKKIKAEKNTRYPDLGNGFGYMRGPWNMNPSKYVVRFSAYSPTLPSCSDYYGGLGLPSFMQFLEDAPYGSHASTHGVIGSVYGCDLLDSFRESGIIVDDESQLQICKKWGFYMKELYRANYIAPRTDCTADSDLSKSDNIDCGFICDETSYDSMLSGLQETIGAQYIKGDMSTAEWSSLRDFICEGDASLIFVGDHLESASPSDPSFWPIHPTQERLLQLKYMVGSVSGEAWPSDSQKDYVCDKSECYESEYGSKGIYAACCYGHYENDQLLDFVNGNKNAGYGLTNSEVLSFTDPTNDAYAMNYIYFDFMWDHCDEDFETEIATLYTQHNMESFTSIPTPSSIPAPSDDDDDSEVEKSLSNDDFLSTSTDWSTEEESEEEEEVAEEDDEADDDTTDKKSFSPMKSKSPKASRR